MGPAFLDRYSPLWIRQAGARMGARGMRDLTDGLVLLARDAALFVERIEAFLGLIHDLGTGTDRQGQVGGGAGLSLRLRVRRRMVPPVSLRFLPHFSPAKAPPPYPPPPPTCE